MNDDMARALETLFYPFALGALKGFSQDSGILFLNALPHVFLKTLPVEKVLCQQYFRPYATGLERAGFTVQTALETGEDLFDAVLLLLPKNHVEAQYYMAHGACHLREGGLLIAAADNKAGGARLESLFSDFGFQKIQALSKHKARVVWGIKGAVPEGISEKALKAGRPQQVLGRAFWSCPGIFGWDKIDRGSKILLQTLPDTLSGSVADFGCGYGYLSHALLQQKKMTSLLCIDADFRALEMCHKNLEGQNCNIKISYLWEDLQHPVAGIRGLDCVVMNPPFHEGKSTKPVLGIDCIRTAGESLKKGGMLWMVCNTHLAYEKTLHDIFRLVTKKFEGQGFKVFCAVK